MNAESLQRAGRIDRIGTEFDTLWIYNMFPDAGLERLLGLVESLTRKIDAIDRSGFLDASILGEIVHPRNFNTLRRISEEDGSVIEEQEQFTELASSEFLVQQLKSLLNSEGGEMLEALPDGIHSGLARANAKGAFFYFQAQESTGRKLHFWRYADLKNESIVDNRYLVANLIACERETPRVVDPELFASIFDLQEKVIEDILKSVQAQRAMEVAPRSTDPIQQTIATLLQNYLNHPDVNRREAIELIRTLNQPMFNVQLSSLRKTYKAFQGHKDVKQLLSDLAELQTQVATDDGKTQSATSPYALARDDLRLICFDVVSGGG